MSSQSETGATIVRIDAHGRIVDRRNSSSYVSALGLSPDGWIVEDQILKRLSGDWVKSADAWRIDSVWAQDGAFHATIGRGRLLVARDGRWTLEPKPGTSSLGEVPNARGGTVHLFRREDGSVVLQDGPDVVRTFPRPSWTEEGGRLRSWSSDSCSGDLLIEVQFDSVFLLGLRRDGMWSFSPPPLFPYFVAGLDGDELLLGSDQSMIRFRSDADEGWVRVASSPLDSASTSGRALVSSGGLVVEDEEGVRFDREGERFPLASPGAQLLGASDGWAFIRDTGNVVAIELP